MRALLYRQYHVIIDNRICIICFNTINVLNWNIISLCLSFIPVFETTGSLCKVMQMHTYFVYALHKAFVSFRSTRNNV